MGASPQRLHLIQERAAGSLEWTAFDHRLLAHLAQGASNLQIALHVGRSEKTARNRLSVLYQELGT